MTTGGDSTSGAVMEVGSAKRRLPPRWAASVIAGLALGLPFAWLLAVLAFLPFYLGLFFFTLIGLLIGAVQFRVGKPAVPWPKAPAY
ncbi:MAG: hypothetical protein JXA69_04975, partial [Phycisphaerae bacterium]|nr:hypothetical protein [Phycisphaerae bacterium]